MATGDLAAAAGLQTYPSSDPVNRGYIYANQRGDDIARVMTRTAALEKNQKAPDLGYNATVTGGAVTGRTGGPHGITDTLIVPKAAYARNVEVNAGCLFTTQDAGYGDLQIRKNGDDWRRVRIRNAGSGTFTLSFYLAANTAVTLQLVADSPAAWAVTDDPRYTWLQALVIGI